MTRETSRQIFRFDAFEIDTFLHEVRQGGDLVPLQRKPCELLVFLVANHSRVVTREEISGQLWGEGRFVDAERGINTAVRKIRNALGDDSEESRFVRTVVGKGYQFIASVEEVVPKEEPAPGGEQVRGTEIEEDRLHEVQPRSASTPPIEPPQQPTGPGAKSGWRTWSMAAIAALLTLGAGLYFYSANYRPALTDRDTILLPPFLNTTGDPVFDLTLRQGLAAQLEQSPLFSIFPEEQTRETLRMMRRSPDEAVTTDIARQICQRQGLKALIKGSIAPLGTHYAITLEALGSATGNSLALVQVEASNKEQVLQALSDAASQMRARLGESVRSLQKFHALLQHTTSSLDALRAYSLGRHERMRGNNSEAMAFFRQAIDLDPNFAAAYAALCALYSNTRQRGLAEEYATKAWRVRDHANERERYLIMSLYYGQVTGELEKRIGVLRLHQESYPRDGAPHSNLAATYNYLGQFEQAVEESRTALRLSLNSPARYAVLANALMHLNRLPEAEQVYRSALTAKLDSPSLHHGLFRIAFVNGNAGEMEQQIQWADRKEMEYAALDWQAEATAARAQQKRSMEFSERASAAVAGTAAADLAAGYLAYAALRTAVAGHCSPVATKVREALAVERNPVSLTRGALALAWCGDTAGVAKLVNELNEQYPRHTLINEIWLPVIRAAAAWKAGRGEAAIDLLKPAARYEAGAEFWPQYVRGQSYLLLGRGSDAEVEFRKVLEHRGQDLLSPLFPLARLCLAQAQALKGLNSEAQRSYVDFRAQWAGADDDLPAVVHASEQFEPRRQAPVR